MKGRVAINVSRLQVGLTGQKRLDAGRIATMDRIGEGIGSARMRSRDEQREDDDRRKFVHRVPVVLFLPTAKTVRRRWLRKQFYGLNAILAIAHRRCAEN
jgi:hypothetical protein